MKKQFFLILLTHFSVSGFTQFIVKDSANHYANFDQNGEQITPWTKFDSIVPSQKGKLNIFRKGVYYGVADLNLEVVIPAKFSKIHFNRTESLIACESGDTSMLFSTSIPNADTNSTENKNGIHIIYAKKGLTHFLFKEKYIKIEHNNLFGALDNNGEEIIPISVDDCFEYKNVLMLMKNNRFGAFTLNHNVLFNPIYNAVGLFEKNSLRFTKGDSTFYFKYNGMRFPYADSIPTFVDGYLKIYHNNKGFLYDYQTLEKVIDHKYEDILPLKQDFLVYNNGKVGVIDNENKIIIQPQYKNIVDRIKIIDAKDTFYLAINQNDSLGIIDQNNNLVIPFEYTHIRAYNKYFMARKADMIGVYDESGNLLIPVKMSFIDSKVNGFIYKADGQFGFLSESLDTLLLNNYNTVKWVENSSSTLIFEKSPYERVLVYNGAIITAKPFIKINKSRNWVKTYSKDSIYYHYFKDAHHNLKEENEYSIKNVVAYPRKKTVNVNYNYTENILPTNFCKKFRIRSFPSGNLFIRSMESSKQGSGIKRVDGNSTYAFNDSEQYLTLIDQKVKLYRNVYLYNSCGYTAMDKVAGVSNNPISISGFSSTAFERVLNLKGELQYYSGENHPYISDRAFQSISHAYSGTLNFEEGDDLVPFKSYVERLQKYNTIEINGSSLFKAMSENKMIKIKDDPQWTILYIENLKNKHYELKGARKVQYNLEREYVLIVNWDWTYEITRADVKKPVISNMVNIKPITTDFNVFFDCINQDDRAVLYNSNGEVILENYNAILRANDYFIEYLNAAGKKKIYSIYKEITF